MKKAYPDKKIVFISCRGRSVKSGYAEVAAVSNWQLPSMQFVVTPCAYWMNSTRLSPIVTISSTSAMPSVAIQAAIVAKATIASFKASHQPKEPARAETIDLSMSPDSQISEIYLKTCSALAFNFPVAFKSDAIIFIS